MRRRGHVARAAALLVAVGAWAVDAHAEASRVVIVHVKGVDGVIGRAERRLAAEMRAAGFEVEDRVVDGADDARQMVEDPPGGGPFATVLLARTTRHTTIDVWVADHLTHKTLVRRLDEPGDGATADRALALRVVELMRASLVEQIAMARPPSIPASGASAPLPPDVASWTQEALSDDAGARAGSVSLALGVAGVYSGPGVGLSVAPELQVTWHFTSSWCLGLLAAAPIAGGSVDDGQRSASVMQQVALGEVRFDPRSRGFLSGFVALGAGAYHLDTTGHAATPFISRSDDVWAAVVGGGGGLQARASRRVSFVLDVRELLALPCPTVAFASTDVARLMHPGTLGSLLLAVDL
jgi:hypothetical protein